jgi:hypothetical protein
MLAITNNAQQKQSLNCTTSFIQQHKSNFIFKEKGSRI